MLGARGKPVITLEDYRNHFGFPVRDYYARVGFDFALETFEAPATEWFEAYNRRRYECRLRDGARETLSALRSAGISQSVLSAYPWKHLVEVMDHYLLSEFFSELSGLDDHYAKGKTESGIRLMERLKADPDSTLLIGDTIHDFETAHAMGIGCILIEHGHQTRERLLGCKVPVFKDFAGLLTYIL